ncbi:PREDICTED: uncharacterized protein K02A2.6-like [Erythranthe guttata]|uniref:uncharacterized protein K02A2.6-like n=1 Tax=Erythranthe guttata TaxID=4155 RepID=UPI00064D73FB|nr:PREDICTED: uncharacterized protein K02A2.6-like [Erythranthe guttata]|eukprot:XP_012851555.1 PREDICTED: uncharacterized protein K02A2.6-like [Erythranthe guttata]
MTSPCPFSQWGIDIVGHFPRASGRRKFLIVAVDYFSKWAEAESVISITEASVLKFLWENICCRYGIPRILISDNGTQFNGSKVPAWCAEMGVQQRFCSVAHPQANGQVEVTNRIIVSGIKKRLEEAKGSWTEELASVLWAYRTTFKSATGESPFSLVYGMEAVLPIEVRIPSRRTQSFNPEQNGPLIRESLDMIMEKREVAARRMERVKAAIKATYDKRVRGRRFDVGNMVLRRADALKM